MKQSSIFKKINQEKVVVMPTAEILTHITVDGALDNDLIKTTSIKKNKRSKLSFNEKRIDFAKEIFDIETDENSTIEFNDLEKKSANNVYINGKKLLRNNQLERTKKEFEENHLENQTDLRQMQINMAKNDSEVNELKGLLANINFEATKDSHQLPKIKLDSQKYDENLLYEEIEKHYRCNCNNCQETNENSLKIFYSSDKLLKRQEQDVQIRENFAPKIKENLEQKIEADHFHDEAHYEFEDNEEQKFKQPIVNKTIHDELLDDTNLSNSIANNPKTFDNFKKTYDIIYSQSTLNEMLRTKICKDKKAYDLIIESTIRKDKFLNDLKNGKYKLNQTNLEHVDKMIIRLEESKTIFLKRNGKFRKKNG